MTTPGAEGHTGLWPAYRPDPTRYTQCLPERWERGWQGISERNIHTVVQHLGLGYAGSLPALANRSMLHYWPERRHSLPGLAALADLKRHSRNQRVQHWQACQHPVREDIGAAYPSHFRLLPSGTTSRLRGKEPAWCLTWFQLCRVVVPLPLPLALFPVPAGAGTRWPRLAGEYETWLWAEQAYDCRQAGCVVVPLHGWGWSRITGDASGWVNWVLERRRTAPGGGREGAIGKLVKRIANAAIGHHGIGTTRIIEVETSALLPGDRPVLDAAGHMTRYVTRTVPGRRTMVHWHRYCEMQVSRSVYQMALPHALSNRLIGIETDCIVLAA